MTDDDDFMRAILASPDDDNVRLVFADYLEETGRSERGEFVRVQCDARRLMTGECRGCAAENRTCPRCGPVLARNDELLRDRGPGWAEPLAGRVTGFRAIAETPGYWESPHYTPPENPHWRGVYFRRGFVHAVRTDQTDWHFRGHALVRRHPLIELVTFNDCEPCPGPGDSCSWDTSPGCLLREHRIPYDLMPAAMRRLGLSRFSCFRDQGTRRALRFPSRADAVRFLSDTALEWAKATEPAPE